MYILGGCDSLKIPTFVFQGFILYKQKQNKHEREDSHARICKAPANGEKYKLLYIKEIGPYAKKFNLNN